MSPKLVGNLSFSGLQCRGEFRLGDAWRIALTGVTGGGMLEATFHAGPLHLPVRVVFELYAADGALWFRPRRGAALLWMLGPFLHSSARTLSIDGGGLRLDLDKSAGGRIILQP